MNARARIERGNDMVQFFCRHMLGLCVTYEARHENRVQQTARFAAYAGTLIKIDNAVCFLTAGHNLREVQDALRGDRVDVKHAVLADSFGGGKFSHPIPFAIRSEEFFFVDDDAEGLDFGVIVLSPYYVRLLAANGSVALEEVNWLHQAEIKFDLYAMLGLPKEFSSEFLSSSGNARVSPTMFPLQRLVEPPAGSASTRFERFVGKINPELGLESLKGMSGGPIFGFRREGSELRYWVVALQSTWLRGQDIVFGCPVPTLASLMTSWVSAGANS